MYHNREPNNKQQVSFRLNFSIQLVSNVTGLKLSINEMICRIVLTMGNNYGVILRRLIKGTLGNRRGDLNDYEAILLFQYYHTTSDKAAHARALEAIEQAVTVDQLCIRHHFNMIIST